MILIVNLLSNFNENIAWWFKEEGLEELHIAIKWLATWFSQKNDYPNTQRIFDYLLSKPPYAIIYFCAAVVAYYWDDIPENEDPLLP